MNESLLLAKIIGIIFFTVSFALLINKKAFRVCINLFKSKEFNLISGIIFFSIGVLILGLHNIWELNWKGVLTLTGWLLAIEGLGRIFFLDAAKMVSDKEVYISLKISLWFTIIVGVYLTINTI